MYFSNEFWTVLEAFATDLQHFCDADYDMSLPIFNEYIMDTLMMALRMLFTKMVDHDYVPPPGPRRQVFMQLITELCMVATKTAEVGHVY